MCGTRKNVPPYDHLRTYGIHPVPWSTLHGPIFEHVIDELDEVSGRRLIKELAEAGFVVVGGQTVHLTNASSTYDDMEWSFRGRTMLRMVKVTK